MKLKQWEVSSTVAENWFMTAENTMGWTLAVKEGKELSGEMDVFCYICPYDLMIEYVYKSILKIGEFWAGKIV